MWSVGAYQLVLSFAPGWSESGKLEPVGGEGHPPTKEVEASPSYPTPGKKGKRRLYANICIANEGFPFLVDTGADTTIVSVETWERVSNRVSVGPLTAAGDNYTGVDGRPLQVTGKTTFIFQFQAFEIPVEVVVARIPAPGLLGIDFLREHDCLLQLGHEPTLFVDRPHFAVPLQEVLPGNSVKVALVGNVVIPAESEAIVFGVLDSTSGLGLSCGLPDMGLLEPKPGLSESHVLRNSSGSTS